MRHGAASRLALPILVSCLALAACSSTPAARTSELVSDDSKVRGLGVQACESIGGEFTVAGGACVAAFIAGYQGQAEEITRSGRRISVDQQSRDLQSVMGAAGDQYTPAAYGFTAGMDLAAAHAGLAS